MDCEKSPLMHKHHIIPRYKGGTDDLENLVEVSITQHAMYHFCNYQLWGNEEDRIAWRGLSGIISREQVVYETILLAQSKAIELARTPEAIEKKRKKLKEIKHQQGERNSQYGKIWITNGTKEGSYRINKGEEIPEGYKPGRISIKENNMKYNFKIITPMQEVIITKNLFQFCLNNNLNYDVMLRVSKGNKNKYKNYMVYRECIIPS